MIESIHPQTGYNQIVNFLNNEMSNPTPGMHSEVVNEMVNYIQSKDYYGFAQELFVDKSYYQGVIFVSCLTSKLLYIQDNKAYAFNFENLDVNRLFVMNETGLAVCYSDVINIYQDTPPYAIFGELQVIMNKEFGSDVYYVKLRFNNDVVATGLMQSVLVTDQILTCYNLRIDKTPYATISFKSAKEMHMSFHVEVEPGVFQSFTYQHMGQVMTVQDTVHSRSSLKELSRLGVVFIDF